MAEDKKEWREACNKAYYSSKMFIDIIVLVVNLIALLIIGETIAHIAGVNLILNLISHCVCVQGADKGLGEDDDLAVKLFNFSDLLDKVQIAGTLIVLVMLIMF